MFEAFIGTIYLLHAGVFAMFVLVERNRNGGVWRLKHIVLMVGAATWPLPMAVAMVAATLKAVASIVIPTVLRAESSGVEAGNRGQYCGKL